MKQVLKPGEDEVHRPLVALTEVNSIKYCRWITSGQNMDNNYPMSEMKQAL